MPRTICLFGELDTYSGSFPQTICALPELIDQLKTACLLYDEVIVNTNVLFDHALTLPAFNALSSFTRAGVLWTSSVEGQGTPEDYIVMRAKKLYGENLNTGISKNANNRLLHIIESWQTILPKKWRLIREVSRQQNNATSNIIYNLKNIPSLSKQAISIKFQLIDLIENMQDEGVFHRNEIIARLGSRRGHISQKELEQLALIVQGEYMNQGAHNKEDVEVVLFPGKYIQYIKRHNYLFKAQALPVDLDTIEIINLRLLNSGCTLKNFISLPAPDLYTLSQSSEWKIWRQYLLSKNYSTEAIKEMKSLQKEHQHIKKTLFILLQNIDKPEITPPTELLLPSSWSTSGLALMGNTFFTDSADKHQQNMITLDLNSRVLTYKKSSLILEKPYATLISLFASTGNSGVPIETIKQLDIEIDLMKRSFKNKWRSQREDNEELDIARLNRLNVTKNRLNKKLEILNIAIHVEKGEGLWSLIPTNINQVLNVVLVGTTWSKNIETQGLLFPTTPAGLTKRQILIWDYLIKHHSTFITANAIAIEINSPNKTLKQISDIMYKFQTKIKDMPFQLIRSYQGEYMLLSTSDD